MKEQLEEQQLTEEEYNESYDCDVCGASLLLSNITTTQQDKTNIWVAQAQCEECETIINLAFDNKQTMKMKDKLTLLREMRQYIETELYIEMQAVEDTYYKHQYNKLTKEEKEKIGPYISHIDKNKHKELRNLVGSKKYTLKTLTKLL